MPSASKTFPPHPQSVSQGRRFVGETVIGWGAGGYEDDVRAVVSELATNAVLHARSDFTITVTQEAGRLVVSVSDASPVRPRMRRFSAAEATTGRGLAMVAQLCRAWGVSSEGPGKTVWCEFDLTAPRADHTPSGSDTLVDGADRGVAASPARYTDEADENYRPQGRRRSKATVVSLHVPVTTGRVAA